MNKEALNSFSRSGLAEKNQLAQAFRLQGSEKPLHVYIQIRASWWQPNWFHALVPQEDPKRFTERRVAVHD